MKLQVLRIDKGMEDFLDPAQMTRVIENALTMQAKAIKVDYNVTTRTWKHKVGFRIEKRPFERDIYTTDKIYGIVSAGSPPHKIRPKNKPSLAFQWGGPGSYRAKSVPRVIVSRQGGPSGPMVYGVKEVNHPGHEGREFEETIGKKWDKESPRQMARAFASEVFM